ncbi:transporter substrate-binding domain-containing protein [Pseudorhodobacter sp.]|uniref:transporter substrate-binding domain-containing protein n=1 Tax=Pseudorhodobacter sp. TaxID=1934400 RepID=UPI0026499B62|nr:transporter substrate-binding domain-containing protein [Pseudorhodobacter sp.]MDN5785676.1 transporter substrate-binding domain-containing protein [Pseudorhodobacter sp.]
MKLTRRMMTAAMGAALAAALAVPASAQDARADLSKTSVIESIKEAGVIKIGLSVFVPWSMRDKKGDLIGFELDVGRKLAADMGVDAEFVPTAWDGIIPALVSGKFDVIISGMSITAERNLTVNFSDPYAYSGLTILANTAMTKDLKTLEDYNKKEVTFAARRGATPATVIQQLFPNATLLLFDEDGASTQEVLNGNAHATMMSEPSPSDEVRKHPETVSIPFNQSFLATGEAFAYRKGDPDATNFFNNWIGVNWKNGWLQERNDYWFKGNAWADQVDQ